MHKLALNPSNRVSLVIISVLVFNFNTRADDWTQWGGDNFRNMVSNEVALADSFHPGTVADSQLGLDLKTAKNVRWAYRLGSQTYGTPAVKGGKVVIGTNDADLIDSRLKSTKGGRLICLDEKTGELIWQLIVPILKRSEYRIKYSRFDYLHLGVCSPPTIDGSRVYVVTNRGDIVCCDMEGLQNGNDGPYTEESQYITDDPRKSIQLVETDADIIWTYHMITELNTWPEDTTNSAVMVVGDYLYVNTSTGIDDPHKDDTDRCAVSLIVLDKKTGKVVATDNEKIPTRVFHGQWSSPAMAQVASKPQVIFGAGDGFCYAFEPFQPTSPSNALPSLKNVWKFDCNPPEYKFRNGSPIEFMATGKGPSNIIATPVFNNNRIYIAVGQDPTHGGGEGVLNCIDPTGTGDISKTGLVWSYKGIGRSISTVAIHDGLIFVAETTGTVHCIDEKTGKSFWRHDTGGEIWGSTLVADGKVYVGNAKKKLWVFAADRQKKILNTITLRAKISTTPVAANGVLYIASNKRLYAVESAR